MIPTQYHHRFEGDSGVDIATQEIDAVFPDGERRRVVFRLGASFMQNGIILIRTELEHLDRTDGPLPSSGSFDTLINGIAWIPEAIKGFRRKARLCLLLARYGDGFYLFGLFRCDTIPETR